MTWQFPSWDVLFWRCLPAQHQDSGCLFLLSLLYTVSWPSACLLSHSPGLASILMVKKPAILLTLALPVDGLVPGRFLVSLKKNPLSLLQFVTDMIYISQDHIPLTLTSGWNWRLSMWHTLTPIYLKTGLWWSSLYWSTGPVNGLQTIVSIIVTLQFLGNPFPIQRKLGVERSVLSLTPMQREENPLHTSSYTGLFAPVFLTQTISSEWGVFSLSSFNQFLSLSKLTWNDQAVVK